MQDRIFKSLGASSHCLEDRQQHDYYATDPKAITALDSVELLDPFIWEPACGEGHMSKQLERLGYTVYSSDLINRNYGRVLDFFTFTQEKLITLPSSFDIVTNPPYKFAEAFLRHALSLIPPRGKVCLLLKLLFLESQSRLKLFKKFPPKTIHVFSKRLSCGKNGVFDSNASAICFAWFVWQREFNGNFSTESPQITWIED